MPSLALRATSGQTSRLETGEDEERTTLSRWHRRKSLSLFLCGVAVVCVWNADTYSTSSILSGYLQSTQVSRSVAVVSFGGNTSTQRISITSDVPPILPFTEHEESAIATASDPTLLLSEVLLSDQRPKTDSLINLSSENDDSSSLSTTATTTKAYTFTPNSIGDTELNIRSWGCERRQESPFTFVHIGKAGGGSVRARLAASALYYNRTRWSDTQRDDTYYYPMQHGKRGILVNSGFHNFRPSHPQRNHNMTQEDLKQLDQYWKSFEKTLPCSAETPLGQAIACPLVQSSPPVRRACHGQDCSIVYTGHNMLGNELHWLPTEYLLDWWQSTPWNPDFLSVLQSRKLRWYPKQRTAETTRSTCHFGRNQQRKRPYFFYKEHYLDCVAPWEEPVDQEANQALLTTKQKEEGAVVKDWSPIYASLPVLRVTMVREPFSWLVSKFFWHQGLSGRLEGRNGTKIPLYQCDPTTTSSSSSRNDNNISAIDFENIANWASPAASKYLLHLCGEDCIVRLHSGQMTLDEAELQSQHNLQHSFAVVGLLNETDTFYDMVTARTAYMNTSLNPEVTGGLHSTSSVDEYERCKKVYQTKEFQQQLLQASPELAALNRLYQVGVQVNRFQLQEMKSCGLL